MKTVSMLLCALFVSGALADCSNSDLFINAPKKLEALSGSCLKIPCSFRPKEEEEFSSSRQIYGVWIIKNPKFRIYPKNLIFRSSGKVATYPMSITGNLSQKDCTTLFSNLTTSYTDKYYFRVENEPYLATAVCNPLQITIQDSPWSPTINISGDLKEKESVTITCSAVTPCPHSPPQLTWSLQQDAHNKTEENPDGTFTTKIQETITLSDTHDGDTINCSVTYPVDGGTYKTAEAQETLNVSYAPKDTSASISPSGLVSAGMWVNLTCSSRAKPPVSSFTWFKNSKHGAMKVSEGEFYSFNATDGGVYYCVATNHLGNQTSQEISLTLEAKQSEQASLLWAIVGGTIGIIILSCVVFILWRRLKSTHSTSHQTQKVGVQEPSRTAEQEDIHYGEIDFSRQRPGASSASVQDSTQQQHTVYSQVNVSRTENSLPQAANGTECIYAQVRKK